MHRIASSCLVLVLAALLAPPAHAAKGQDHPLVGRYEGSKIVQYQQREFDEYALPLGAYEDGEYADKHHLEGKITWIGYRNPDDRSTLEVFRNYQEKLASEGFEELWRCESSDECGYWFASKVFHADPERFLHAYDTGADEGIRYLAAKRASDEGDVYVQLAVYDDGNNIWTRVRVIEQKAREKDKILVKADEMARQLDDSGSVALYGIYFDYDKATLKADSEPTLKEIAKLLEKDPELELLVVGHTDNQGDFAYNKDLSERRAAAVVTALVEDHGIARERLEPHGVAFLAPVATNATEEGRAKNRRVELVAR